MLGEADEFIIWDRALLKYCGDNTPEVFSENNVIKESRPKKSIAPPNHIPARFKIDITEIRSPY
jgi:hypothetical protein